MANKRWSFKVPGDPGGSEKVVDIGEISSVYDLLDNLRKDEVQPRQKKKQASQPGPGSGGVLIPFASRRMEKRRHPSA